MKPFRIIVVFTLLYIPSFSFTLSANNTDALVLVCADSADYQSLTRFEIRKLFLGYPVKKNGKELIAIRNTSNEAAYQIFLQKVIHLSAKNYERQLLSKTFRTGTSKVLIENSPKKLLSKLKKDETLITFMLLSDAKTQEDIKIIQTLWQKKAQ